MDKRVWAALPVAIAGLGLAASRALVGQWKRNPDPLNGRPVAFPTAEARVISLPDGARIATFRAGHGPTIVCVHGLTSSHHDWGPMAPALIEAGFSLLAIDQRGHGASTSGTAGYGSAQLGHDLGYVLEELDVNAVALMGHSMGGMAAMAYAVDQPLELSQRVGSMILIGTAASLEIPGSSSALRLSGFAIPEWVKPSNQRLRVGTGLSVFGRAPSLHMIDQALLSATRLPEEVRAKASSALADHNVLDRLAQVRCPSLVIGGTRDRLIRPSQVRQLAQAIPDAQLKMLDGAGHLLIWERHADITELVTDFLS